MRNPHRGKGSGGSDDDDDESGDGGDDDDDDDDILTLYSVHQADFIMPRWHGAMIHFLQAAE